MASDFHTHHVNHARGVPRILSVTNPTAITPDDGVFLSLERHPWNLADEFCPESEHELAEKLTHCVVFGEIGLDRLRGPDMNIQLKYFEYYVNIARRCDKPIILHSVRAEAEVLRACDDYADRCLIHGFQSTVAKLEKYLSLGFWVSLSPKILRNEALISFLRTADLTRIGVESDDDSAIDVREFIKKLELMTGRELEDVFDRNFYRFIGVKANE